MNLAYCCRYEGRAVEICVLGMGKGTTLSLARHLGPPHTVALISLQDGICGGAAAPRSLTDFCRRAALAR